MDRVDIHVFWSIALEGEYLPEEAEFSGFLFGAKRTSVRI